MKPGHVNSFTHLDMLSLMQFIQLGEKFVPIFLFHSCSIHLTSQKRSLYCGGSCFVYPRLYKMSSNRHLDMYGVTRNGAPSKTSTFFVDQNARRSEPSTVKIKTYTPIHRRNSPCVKRCSDVNLSLTLSMMH